MQLSSVTLEAKDVPSTVSYLSKLLDLDISPISQDEILLKNQVIAFKVIPGAKSKKKGNTIFDLLIDDYETLKEISLKAQFLQYRFDDTSSIDEKNVDGEIEQLELTDPDGRRWRFSKAH